MILIVEDARELSQLMRDYLHMDGYETHCLYEGSGVVAWVKEHKPELILLDLMLPGRDGMSICKDIRAFSKVPIIVVTAKVEEDERLSGLDGGADDYICKPFSPREMVSRVRAVLRRSDNGGESSRILQFDQKKLQARINGNVLDLTVVEFHLIQLMAESPGRVYSRSQLIDSIYPDQRMVGDRTIDSHVKKLRKKIALHYPDELIHSVYSAGYKYEEK